MRCGIAETLPAGAAQSMSEPAATSASKRVVPVRKNPAAKFGSFSTRVGGKLRTLAGWQQPQIPVAQLPVESESPQQAAASGAA